MSRSRGTYAGRKFVLVLLLGLVTFGVFGIIGTYYLAESLQPLFRRSQNRPHEGQKTEEALRKTVEQRRSQNGG